nr:MAG TPA: hypothetical protein [Caudoviricetes sp.]
MKVEIEIPDLEELYCTYDEESVTGKDVKQAIADMAIEKFIDQLYNNYIHDEVYHSIVNDTQAIIKERSDEIIDKVIEQVSKKILAKKAIVNEMPKKTEVANINKEWEQYFIELIDKAIAKRFK